jgi:hypothetical protein
MLDNDTPYFFRRKALVALSQRQLHDGLTVLRFLRYYVHEKFALSVNGLVVIPLYHIWGELLLLLGHIRFAHTFRKNKLYKIAERYNVLYCFCRHIRPI